MKMSSATKSAESMNSIATVCLIPKIIGTKKAENKCVRLRILERQGRLLHYKLGNAQKKNSPSVNKLRNDKYNLAHLAPSGQVCHAMKPA